MRPGLLALAGALAGVALLIKSFRRPDRGDLRRIVVGLVAWGVLWVVTIGSVRFAWETREVVTLRPVDAKTGEPYALRVWVVDDEVTGDPAVFYDGKPERLTSIGRQSLLEWERGGVRRRSRPVLHWAEDADPAFVDRIFALYDDRYGDLEWLSTAYFVLAGREAGRTIGIFELGEVE